jgi:isopropylmalate/homocitrate/citramalate synthase
MQRTRADLRLEPRPGAFDYGTVRGVELNDETLRDGLQSPSSPIPPIEDKVELLHLMAELGIAAADIGLPGAGPRAVGDVEALAREIGEQKAERSSRTAPLARCAPTSSRSSRSRSGRHPIEAACFIGSSPIRQYAEGWTLDRMLRATEDAVGFASAEGLPVMYVTEDTTRARPRR